MVERQTHDAQNVAPLRAWEFKSPLGYYMTRVGQRPAEFHTLRTPGATPGPATYMTGYANWQSDEVENLMPVGSTPTSVTDNLIPWSNGEDTCATCRKVMVRFHPGSLRC